MQDFIFHSDLLVRTPALPYTDFKSIDMATVLLDNKFQQAILLASKELHAELLRSSFIFARLNQELQASVYKYYNRMSYRPTPFGAFASVAMTKWVEEKQLLVRASGHRLMVFSDFHLLHNADFIPSDEVSLYLNPSMFKSGNEYRYYARNQMNNGTRDAFRIMTIPKSGMLKKLFAYVKSPVSYQSIIDYLNIELRQPNAAEVVANLVREQILFHSLMPAVTRKKFPVLRESTPSSDNSYVIAYHQQHGGAYTGDQYDLRDGLWALSHLALQPSSKALNDFAKKFTERFEGAEVPLLRALDPQTGVSYLGTEKTTMQNEGLGEANNQPALNYLDAGRGPKTLILRKLINYDRKMEEGIVLSQDEVGNLEDSGNPSLSFPPSIAVTFRLYGEKIFIENAGGSSAINMAGRFSHDDEVLTTVREIAEHEQQQNPQVVFAEIAAVDNSITDNINTRGHLRDYEIPVLAHSELLPDRAFCLNDLTIQVINDQVVLRSLKLKKRIIPKLGTAYNYALSNLPLFRFLADLQYQGLKHNFSFDLETLVPGLAYYPRVSYKNCILSPEKWIVDLAKVKSSNQTVTVSDKFLSWACKEKLSKRFVLADQDRELVFDRDCDLSIAYFLRIIKSRKRLVLKECFLPDDSTAVTDQLGKKYVSQMVAFFINQQTVYNYVFPRSARQFKAGKKRFLPGGDWCCFKVYAHLETQNALLRDPKFLKLLLAFCKIKGIKRWFYVRYADPKPHLRLRFRVSRGFDAAFSAEFSAVIKKYLENNLVNEYVVATYEPEFERYGHAGMNRVESIFHHSSELVLAFHQLGSTADQETIFAASSVDRILSVFFANINDRLKFVQGLSMTVSTSQAIRIRLDQYYRAHRESLEDAVDHAGQRFDRRISHKAEKLAGVLLKSQSIFESLAKIERDKLLADLIHMHINRLNASGRAELEVATYYLLFKLYKSLATRNLPSAALNQSCSGVTTK